MVLPTSRCCPRRAARPHPTGISCLRLLWNVLLCPLLVQWLGTGTIARNVGSSVHGVVHTPKVAAVWITKITKYPRGGFGASSSSLEARELPQRSSDSRTAMRAEPGSDAPPSSSLRRRTFVRSTLLARCGGFLGDTGTSRITAASDPGAAIASATVPSLLSLAATAARLNDDDDTFVLSHQCLVYPHPGLRHVAAPVTSFFDSSTSSTGSSNSSDLEIVVETLLRTMTTNATTASQYGIDARILILRGTASPQRDGRPVVLINPTILTRSSEDKLLPWREYCLVVVAVGREEEDANTNDTNDKYADDTIVGYRKNNDSNPNNRRSNTKKTVMVPVAVDVVRDEFVEIAAQDYLTSRPIRKVLQGESACAFQYELDHLNGIVLIDHANSLTEFPPEIAQLEGPFHAARHKKAVSRSIYEGNGPLYY